MRGRQDLREATTEVHGPIRTCVGCRRRDRDARLLRVVSDPEAAALSPDPRRQAAGRGAWVHRDERCIATALDRRAFVRALRMSGNVSHDALSEVLEEVRREHETATGHRGRRAGNTNEERTRHDEHTVKHQR